MLIYQFIDTAIEDLIKYYKKNLGAELTRENWELIQYAKISPTQVKGIFVTNIPDDIYFDVTWNTETSEFMYNICLLNKDRVLN